MTQWLTDRTSTLWPAEGSRTMLPLQVAPVTHNVESAMDICVPGDMDPKGWSPEKVQLKWKRVFEDRDVLPENGQQGCSGHSSNRGQRLPRFKNCKED